MVIACDFSPNFDLDDTIVCMTAQDADDYNDTNTDGEQACIQQGNLGQR